MSSLGVSILLFAFLMSWHPSSCLVNSYTATTASTTSPTYDLKGKRVLVTGSSGGIGRAIALKLAQEGASVLIHYHVREQGALETQRLILEQGGSCAGIVQCDFRNLSTILPLFQQQIDQEIWKEGLDILINNAGAVSKLAMEDDDEQLTQWHDTLNVNLHAPRLLSQLALQRMKHRPNGGGVIINVSSIHGERSNEYMSAYAVSKAGLEMLTRSMAMEFAPYNVRVNAIAPGVVVVERSADVFADPTNVKPWTDRLLTEQLGAADQIAHAMLPLITNEWITGTIWQIDGGMMARANMPPRDRPPPPPQQVCK